MGKKTLLGFSLLLSLSLLLPFSAAASASPATIELWCVAKNNAADSALEEALNWACGPGGANCDPIQQGGPCYDASDVQSMASFAFNAYFLKNSMANHSCYFQNSAALTSLDPSHDKCKFPSSLAVRNESVASSSTAAAGVGPADVTSGGGHDRTVKLFSGYVLVFCTIYLIG